jgi:hypothetical protein
VSRDEKIGETSDRGHVQPEAMEVESARQLEAAAADRLKERGERFDGVELRRRADEYIALDRGTDTDEFIAWMSDHRSGT